MQGARGTAHWYHDTVRTGRAQRNRQHPSQSMADDRSDTGLSTGQAADLRAASSCSHVNTSTGVRAHVRVRESKIDCGGANLWKMGARGSGISRLSSGAGRANSKGPPQPVPSDVARRTHRTQRLFLCLQILDVSLCARALSWHRALSSYAS